MSREPIAIIGIGCRFPGAADPRQFWSLLSEGREAIGPLPPGRWDAEAFFDTNPATPGKMPCRVGGYLEGIDLFDPGFFGISADEARAMDPQQRLMLEVAWEAIELAGIAPKSLAGTDAGVFVGVSSLNYGSLAQFKPETINRYTNTGIGGTVCANRISYFLDLRGPSFSVDSACASSLLAVHLACRAIWEGETSVALAGGVNAILLPGPGIGLARSGMMAADGKTRVFDANASGWVRGEGAGVVVLKPLVQAMKDGNSIYAIIRGSAVNQNGRSNGLSGPSRAAQEAVLRKAYEQAGLRPGDVQYVEAHSNGTLIGDAVELAALGNVLKDSRPASSRCAVGSLKANIGHLEAAAGIAGVIKVALMLHHRQFVPTLHHSRPNPHAPIENLPLRIQTTAASWDSPGERIAGVSASGYGGANVHVVLSEAPADAIRPTLPTGHRFNRQRYWMDAVEVPMPASAMKEQAASVVAVQRPAILDAPIPPRNDVERRLLKLWESTIRVSPVGIRDSFFEIGGTSALALQLFAGIEKEFGCALPLAKLYSAPTVETLGRLLALPDAATKWEPMVAVNEHGTQPALFYVPGLGGHAFDLHNLTRELGPDQPVYMLHPHGLDPGRVPLSSVEEMAAAFIKHVRAVQPHGPYRLGGYSFGGSVAFEMARQLESTGESTCLLALLDAYAPGAFQKRPFPVRVATHLRQLWKMPAQNRRHYLRDRMGGVWRRLRLDALGGSEPASKPGESTVIDAVQRVTDANVIAWRTYRPRPWSGRIVLFRAR
ncbi:MAG TPA: beta-ketoacyl synthase N-terminal-like domain-containing protein, partial [Tepidisphaeraceae bacterium]|nr:beta-ketoacyl synthase N-terminal-like domain-containing protein [Tepidisphaeraceae bacterium]